MPDRRSDNDKLVMLEDETLGHSGDLVPHRGSRESYSYAESAFDDGAYAYLRELLRRVRKHTWLIAFLTLIITTIVTIQAFRSKSIYRASTTIEVPKSNRTVYKTAAITIESDEADFPYITSIAMKTTIRSLKSRPMLEDVVELLKLDQDPRFMDVTSKKSIFDSIKTISSRVFSRGSDDSQPAVTEDQPLASRPSIVRGADVSARLAPYVSVIRQNLTAEQVEDTRMLSISYDHTDPVLAATIANSMAQIFSDRSFNDKQTGFTKSNEWLDEKTRKLEAEVQKKELELANFAGSNNLITTGEQGKENLTLEKLSGVYGSALKAEMDRIIKQSLYEEVKAGRVFQLPESFTDPKLGALKSRYDELSVQEAQYAGRFGPENPKVKDVTRQKEAIQKQLDDGKSSLESRLKADYERALREEKALKESFDKVKREAIDQNQAVIKYGMQKQELEAAKQIYQNFVAKAAESDLQRAERNLPKITVIEPAFVPSVPIAPNRLRIILMGLIASLALGIATALILEYLDSSIKTVEDVARFAGVPTLGVIPAIGGRKNRMLSSRQKTPRPTTLIGGAEGVEHSTPSAKGLTGKLRRSRTYAQGSLTEAYRGLRTSILLSAAGHAPKSILFTSSQPSEGKTTTTINTAISLTQLGASVLIVDADMRRPSTHRVFKVPHTPGLSTFLSRDVELAGLVQELSIPNLSLLPCGPVPPNPAELISSSRMRDLIQLACEQYDHVLIDSPPLINVSDPLILSTLVDGVILVVQGGRSSRAILRRARVELANVGAKIYGVVLNNVDWRREGYNDYYYYYNRYYSSEYQSTDEPGRASSSGD